MTSLFANDVIIIRVLKKIPVLQKNSAVKNCNFHSNCFTRQCGCIIKVQWIHCIPLDSEKCQIKQLQEFLKSDHWLRRYCILSGGVFSFEPPCI